MKVDLPSLNPNRPNRSSVGTCLVCIQHNDSFLLHIRISHGRVMGVLLSMGVYYEFVSVQVALQEQKKCLPAPAPALKTRTVQSSQGSVIPDILSCMLKDTTSEHKAHLFDLKCKICTGELKRFFTFAVRSTLLSSCQLLLSPVFFLKTHYLLFFSSSRANARRGRRGTHKEKTQVI